MGINRGINPWMNSLPNPELVPQFRGDWAQVPYEAADMVSHRDALYIAIEATKASDTPGASTAWRPVLGSETVNSLLTTVKGTLTDISNKDIEYAALNEQLAQTTTVLKDKVNDVQQLGAILQTYVGIKPLAALPTSSNPPGIYRVTLPTGTFDINWDGTAEVARTVVVQPSINNLKDYTYLEVPDGSLGVPTKNKNMLQFQKTIKLHGQPYGMRDNAAVLSVIASPAADPSVEILGLQSLDQAAEYPSRDVTAAYIGIVAPQANKSTGSTTTYTATSVVAPGIDLSNIKKGMWLDTEHYVLVKPDGTFTESTKDVAGTKLAKWGGLVTGWDIPTQTIYVQRWDRLPIPNYPQFAVKGGVPSNGQPVVLSPQTAVWGANITAGLNEFSHAHTAYGLEITTFNTKGNFNPALPQHDPANKNIVGIGSYNIGFDAYTHFSGGGNSYYGYMSRGAKYAGYSVQHQYGSGFQSTDTRSPTFGFLDQSQSSIGFCAETPKAGGAFISLRTTDTAPGYISRGSGAHFLVQDANETQRFKILTTDTTTLLGFGNNIKILSNQAEDNVLRIEGTNAIIMSGTIRLNAPILINDKKVLGPQLPGIKHSTGTAEDNARAINELIDRLSTHGLIAPL